MGFGVICDWCGVELVKIVTGVGWCLKWIVTGVGGSCD